jgi:hypothetical protein
LERIPATRSFYQVKDKAVTRGETRPFDLAWHAAISFTLADEWESPEDDRRFRELSAYHR